MLIKLVSNDSSVAQTDLGQYDVIKKRAQLWVSSLYAPREGDMLVIKEFELPKDCEKIELVDNGGDDVLDVPVDVFNKSLIKGEGYKFDWYAWRKKYLKPF